MCGKKDVSQHTHIQKVLYKYENTLKAAISAPSRPRPYYHSPHGMKFEEILCTNTQTCALEKQ